VARVSKETPAGRLDVGWAELAAGRWEAAREFFDDALAASENGAAG
jgi:hypothetical protein